MYNTNTHTHGYATADDVRGLGAGGETRPILTPAHPGGYATADDVRGLGAGGETRVCIIPILTHMVMPRLMM